MLEEPKGALTIIVNAFIAFLSQIHSFSFAYLCFFAYVSSQCWLFIFTGTLPGSGTRHPPIGCRRWYADESSLCAIISFARTLFYLAFELSFCAFTQIIPILHHRRTHSGSTHSSRTTICCQPRASCFISALLLSP